MTNPIPIAPRTGASPPRGENAAPPTGNRLIHVGLGWFQESPGGLERYQHGLCTELARQGYATEAWVVGDSDQGPAPRYHLEAFAEVHAPRARKRSGLRAGLADSMQRGGVLATHHATHAAMIRPLLGRLPHVVHFHGPWALESQAAGENRGRTWLKERMERRVYRSADRLITLSKAFRQILIERYGVDPQRVRVVPGGIDTQAFSPGIDRAQARRELGWAPDVPTLFTVRRLTPRMGLETLLDAMPKILQTHPRVQLYIGGQGPIRAQLETQIEALALQDRVKLLGFVTAEQLPLAYAAADVSVVPTRELEGFGLVCLESLAAGTPVLVTPVGGLPEVVEGLNPRLIMPGFTAEDLAAGIRDALSHPDALPSSAECEDYIRQTFDWSVTAGQVAEVYREAAEAFAQRRGKRGVEA